MAYSLNALLDLMIRENASDLHLVVGREPIVRQHGSLLSAGDPHLTPSEIRKLADDICEKGSVVFSHKKGGVEFSFDYNGKARFRVSIYNERGNYALSIRLIPSRILSLEEIGLPSGFIQLLNRPRGLILVTGPTGCGKTTTLAAMIDYINSNFGHHIITIEDPIEYYHKHKMSIVNQRQIGDDVPSFHEAIIRGLRQDPDVIMVGEMRDLETISAAITAAETGHLVFGTLHTVGASTTVSRMIDVFPPDQQEQIRIQLSLSLVATLTQQLIPNKESTGRHAAFEILTVTGAVSHLIRENKTFRIDSIIETGKQHGMVFLDDSIYSLYSQGKISSESAIWRAQDPEGMRKKIFGVQNGATFRNKR